MPHTDGSSKTVRSDLLTKLLLDLIHKLAADDEVKAAVRDIIEHTDKRSSGGKTLLDLTKFARREALRNDDLETAERLDDLAGHSTGRILTADLDRKYHLFSHSRTHHIDAIELAISNAYLLGRHRAEQYLQENPGATGADLAGHLKDLSETSIKVVEDREAGNYRVLRLDTESQVWLAEVLARRLGFEDSAPEPPPSGPPADVSLSTLVEAAHLRLRKEKLAEIRRVVEDRYSREAHLQQAVSGSFWLFGGSHIGEAGRRRYATGTEVDIPLLRPDGSLHIVELKLATARLVKRYRTGLIVHPLVHEATSQVMNYLRAFDENRGDILARHGLDPRRATGTVVIGHPMFQPEFSEQEIAETLRTYNAEHSRISVISYKELLDNAERTLTLSEPPG
ncbi:Shedu anti-phage system protein SduA domain-containing protein [Amycolatopsis sp. NPDC088138]|uniref:Shedu anti-phage system protein SduA domain-containing protein n=1 Tax=Amycolatopsis sp. NPDC088138 TaxID=3363938 RepID=UPI003827BE08